MFWIFNMKSFKHMLSSLYLISFYVVRREPQQQLQLFWSHFTEPLGKVKFLHCLPLSSGLQVKETHTN